MGNSSLRQKGRPRPAAVALAGTKDGDVLNEEWVATDGIGNKGTWKNVGGTGKFANAKSTGQWEFSPLQGKMGAVRWIGNCQ